MPGVCGSQGLGMPWLTLNPGPSPTRGEGEIRAERWGVPMWQNPLAYRTAMFNLYQPA